MKVRRSKALLLILCVLLLCGSTVAQTLAYMFDQDGKVNTFTVGSVRISLEESTGEEYTMNAPGAEIEKDPAVKILEGSAESWVFIKLAPSDNFSEYLTYEVIEENWVPLDKELYPGVYYYKEPVSHEDGPLPVLRDNKVSVIADEETLGLLNLNGGPYPTLVITAYAVQLEGVDNPQTAWSLIPET